MWPPPEDELSAWEVIELEPAGQPTPKPSSHPPPEPTGSPAAEPRQESLAEPGEARAAVHADRGRDHDAAARDLASTRKRAIALDAAKPADAAGAAPGGVPLALAVAGLAGSLVLGFGIGRWVVPASGRAGGSVPLRVTFESIPAGAEVIVDGSTAGSTPARIEVPPASERIEVRWPGTQPEGTSGGKSPEPAAGSARAGDEAATGSVAITTDPPGVPVVMGGQRRGTTPLVVTSLLPGVHEVELAGPRGSVIERVTVRAGRESRLDATLTRPPAPTGGWVVARAGVPLRMSEGGRRLGTGEGRVVLPAGRHDVTFSADDLEFSITRSVVVNVGATTTVDIELPQGQANFNAQPWAEVEVNGRRLGETPLGNVLLPLGRHTAVFRHPQLGQRQVPFVVRARTPARVSVSMSQ